MNSLHSGTKLRASRSVFETVEATRPNRRGVIVRIRDERVGDAFGTSAGDGAVTLMVWAPVDFFSDSDR